MSPTGQARVMEHGYQSLDTLVSLLDGHNLVAEIHRYLDTVGLFRELGCEPHWRSEALPATEVVQRIALYARATTT